MSLTRYDARERMPLLRAAIRALADRLAQKLEPVTINVAELPADLAEPLRPFLNGVQSLSVAEAHRLFACFGALMAHRKELYRRQIELVQAASALEREVSHYQRLLTDNRR